MESRGRPMADRMPAIGQLSGSAQRDVRVAADPDRDAILLDRLREHAHLAHSVVRAWPLDGFPSPALPHQTKILVRDAAALGEGRRAQCLELLAAPVDS